MYESRVVTDGRVFRAEIRNVDIEGGVPNPDWIRSSGDFVSQEDAREAGEELAKQLEHEKTRVWTVVE